MPRIAFSFPPDAEAALPREPIVFEDEDHEGGEVSRPSLGQQVAGEAKQVEFTLTTYRGTRGGPKSCRLGRVTQIDQARAQRASLPARSVRCED